MRKFTSAQAINLAKLELEAKYEPQIKKIFNNIANDVASLYPAINSEIAENYSADFVAKIRDIMRETCDVFSYSLRGNQTKQSEEEEANNQFVVAIALFIANQSENKAKFITDTNKVMISYEIEKAENQARLKALKIQDEINKTTDEKKKKELIAKKNAIQTREAIAKNIQINLLDRADSRSEAIAEDIVGASEAFTRYEEAKLLQKINPNDTYVKEWVALLDSKTRGDHVKSDGQVVPINQPFVIGGELLQYPRDPNGSLAQTAGCRCIHIIKKLRNN